MATISVAESAKPVVNAVLNIGLQCAGGAAMNPFKLSFPG
jgi:hypothetical protein